MKQIKIKYPKPPATEDSVRAIETLVGAELPTSYREFMLVCNGGVLDWTFNGFYPKAFENRPDGWGVHLFYTTSGDVSKTINILWAINAYRGRVPSSLLPIGTDGEGNLYCLGLRGKHREKVYFWDHEGERGAFELIDIPVPENSNAALLADPKLSEDVGAYWQNVSLVCDSFESFVDALEKIDLEK